MNILMEKMPRIIKGGEFEDERGRMRFVNDFLMDEVKRMYLIEQKSTSIIRAWQGHKVEQKWFYVLEGRFEVQLIKPDDWETPSQQIASQRFLLSAKNNEILHIPGGYANGFRALTTPAKLLVFSDVEMKDVEKDNFRFDKDYWKVW